MIRDEGVMRKKNLFLNLIGWSFLLSSSLSASEIYHAHALSLFGDVKYDKDFSHFDYANPNAPKGGMLTLSATGGFDTLNALNGKGTSAPGISLLYDNLMTSSLDEPASEYGLIAETVRYPEDYAWVEYDLRENAKWSDGQKITPEDVIFSLNILKEKGSPIYRYYYANITRAVKISDKTVRFEFDKGGNRELPLITGQLTILPKHYWQDKDFSKSMLEKPIGSGPYEIKDFTANRTITFQKRKDYWAKNLPVNKGQYNFETIKFEMFRDSTVQFEAFKSGDYDYRSEFSAKNWAKGYDFPDVLNGKVKKELTKSLHPKPMQGLIFNLRKEKFQNLALRQALTMVFDFEWLNENIFFESYKRSKSFFEESELEAAPLPSKQELALFSEFKETLPEDMFKEEFDNQSEGAFRTRLRGAMSLLKEAGYVYKRGLLHDASGEKITIEILNTDPSFERVLIPIVSNFKKIGIDAAVRTVDPAQYTSRTQNFDFDMIMSVYAQSSSPGNEQREYWGSAAADRIGSRNLAGIKDPMIDRLIEKLIFAKDRKGLVTATHALDRALQWKQFLIPLWYAPADRIAYRDKFGKPKVQKIYGMISPIQLWWDKNK